MILSLKTDSDIAELYLSKVSGEPIEAYTWESGRNLSSELLEQIKQLLVRHNADWANLTGVIVFRGPGSFTGLRIGATVANAIAYAQHIPIVGTVGDDWRDKGLRELASGINQTQVVPHYGAEPNITKPKR